MIFGIRTVATLITLLIAVALFAVLYTNAHSINALLNEPQNLEQLDHIKVVKVDKKEVSIIEVSKKTISDSIAYSYSNLLKWVWYIKTNFNQMYVMVKNIIIHRQRLGLSWLNSSFKLISFSLLDFGHFSDIIL